MNDRELKELLRQKRQEIAAFQSVPVYMIFANKVIDSIVAKKPKTAEDLLTIKGMGEKKVKQFGQIILSLVNDSPPDKEETVDRPEGVFSVSEFIAALNIILTAQKATVQGEVVSFDDRGNYAFLSLKDPQEDAVLRCFIWKDSLLRSGVDIEEGMEIRVFGNPEVYARTSGFTFRITNVELVGEGALQIAFERLKQKLEQEGLFDPQRKKTIPTYIKSLGLITSPFADAKKDFLTHLAPFGIKVHFYPVHVEGIHSVDDILGAIRFFNESNLDLDALVITRGGGSLESLQAFNAESLARAIHASKIPVIVGVGHENDVTIADLVADLRASTPTDAGKIISRPWEEAQKYVADLRLNLEREFSLQLSGYKNTLATMQKELVSHYERELLRKKEALTHAAALLTTDVQQIFTSMKHFALSFQHNGQKITREVDQQKHQLVMLHEQLSYATRKWLTTISTRVTQSIGQLEGYDPLARLQQGYSIVERFGKIVKTIEDVKTNDQLDIRLADGQLHTSVLEKEKRYE